MSLSRRQHQFDGIAKASRGRGLLVVSPPRDRPIACSPSFFFAPRACLVRPDNGGIDHHVFQVVFDAVATRSRQRYMMIDANHWSGRTNDSAGAQKKTASKRSVDPAATDDAKIPRPSLMLGQSRRTDADAGTGS